MIRRFGRPSARAASTNSRSLRESTFPRTIRAGTIQVIPASTSRVSVRRMSSVSTPPP